ncbi:hypothetical protein Poli38472_001048 [Pythium oligandrum]|uniref:Mitochondrial import inner membrane translocase subunit TIM22 n=1 Tax=Pythium oligandrum TaxID=41045 RepID=A0A8K1CU64_PYTOL|nr:hypothetical protein Poli38472_001048 [Pythium oligandrum]|eukprot:TMW68892.1 hypothetical protein Poli38472_001048 [Pythium oligandrum]
MTPDLRVLRPLALPLSRFRASKTQQNAQTSEYRVLATSSKHTTTDCVSSTALMVYRGVGAGIAWTIAVDLYALVSASDRAWQEHLDTLTHPSTKARELRRLLLRTCGRNVLMFGGFLAVFGGLTCSLELVRGRHDMVNPFVGGFASGLVIMPRDLYKAPKNVLLGSALCGLAAMSLYQYIPASSQGRVETETETEQRELRPGVEE